MTKENILVCGTGIAGLATALGLAKKGFQVSLLGPKADTSAAVPDSYHPRVYALSVASQQFLIDLGVWDLMDARRITPVDAMEVYGDGDGELNLHAWQAASISLAWIVESGELERVLQQAVRILGVSWITEKFQRWESGVVFTDTGRALHPDLLVGADGAHSPVRSAANIRHDFKAYGDHGVVVHLDAQLAHQNIALQWFTGDSILALLPMPDTNQGHQVSMVWSMPESRAKYLQQLPNDQRNAMLTQELAAVTGDRLGKLHVRSPLFAFPLTLEGSDMVAPGVALVGDAAHRVHPLAGQGLNLGLADVAELLRVLTDKEQYRSAGDMRVLSRYRRARAEPILAMRLATDGLHRLFASKIAAIAWARNLGMRGVNHLPLLKRFLIGGAAGR
ncbi:FAD-dependent monooxygenase [Alcaligenaceae bacterium]|nr:FAD-dependent monooxygenase [Alcaligenaceae bacterium]